MTDHPCNERAGRPRSQEPRLWKRGRLARNLTTAVMLASLAACSWIFGSEPPVTRLKVTLAASPQVNPNQAGVPSPVVVRVYELKALDEFDTADFFTLYDADTRTLAQNMISRREMILRPGETRTIQPDSVQPDTRFIAVMAAFRDEKAALWRADLPVVPLTDNDLTFRFDPQSISARTQPAKTDD